MFFLKLTTIPLLIQRNEKTNSSIKYNVISVSPSNNTRPECVKTLLLLLVFLFISNSLLCQNNNLYFPRYSDICLSSRYFHPNNKDDSQSTFRALDSFYASRLIWSYISDKKTIDAINIKKITFSAALNTILADSFGSNNRLQGRMMDLEGHLLEAPWMKGWKTYWGCMNSPDFKRIFIECLDRYLSLKINSIQIDDFSGNYHALEWGGCFCDSCMLRFDRYLHDAYKMAYFVKINPNKGEVFNFKKELILSGYSSNNLNYIKQEKLFVDFKAFQKQTVKEFYADVFAFLKSKNQHVVFTCNNYDGNWNFLSEYFDYGVAELPEKHANPEYIYKKQQESMAKKKYQVFTLVSESPAINRKVIAMTYSTGGQMIVPWDVYISSNEHGAKRYFGNFSDYNYMYRFVHENKKLFDNYEQVYFVTYKYEDKILIKEKPFTIENLDSLSVSLRVDNTKKSYIIHVVNWSYKSNSCKLNLNSRMFNKIKSVKIYDIVKNKSMQYGVYNEYSNTILLANLNDWAVIKIRI